MKKLLTLAILTISLTSCNNTGGDQINDLPNESKITFTNHRNEAPKNKTNSETDVKNAINAVIYEASRNNTARGALDPSIDPTDPNNPYPPTNPGEPEFLEYGTIICSDNVNSNFGSACVINNSGSLVRVSWEPRRDLFYMSGPGGNSGTWLIPPDTISPSQKTYTGTVVSSCNCN